MTKPNPDGLREQVEHEIAHDHSDEISRAEAEYARVLRESNGSGGSAAASASASRDACFKYAYWLIRSRRDDERQLGLRLLEATLLASDPLNREYLYYFAYGLFLDGQLARARKTAVALLQEEPENRQAMDLNALIENRMRSEGLQGMAIVAGGSALVIGAIALGAFAIHKLRK